MANRCLSVVLMLLLCACGGGGGGGGGGGAAAGTGTVSEPSVSAGRVTVPQGQSVGATFAASRAGTSAEIEGCPADVVCRYDGLVLFIYTTGVSRPGSYPMSIQAQKTECVVLFGCVTTVVLDTSFALEIVPAVAPISFRRTTYLTPFVPTRVWSMPVTQGGRADLLVASDHPGGVGSVSVYAGVGDGTFIEHSHHGFPGTINDLEATDFDQDGELELVVALGGTEPGIAVQELAGGTSGWVMRGSIAKSVDLADVTADGLPDLLAWIYAPDGARLVVLHHPGGSGFEEVREYPLAGGVGALAVVDIGGDGDIDVVAASRPDPFGRFSVRLEALINDGTGELRSSGVQEVSTRRGIHSLFLADINGDRNLDALIGGTTVRIALGDGLGNFAAATEHLARRAGVAVPAMLNDDLWHDIVTLDAESVTVMINDGVSRNFNPRYSYSVANPGALAIGDLNGDGRADLVVASGVSRSLEVWISE